MSTKVFPYSPRSPSPRTKYEDSSASAKSIDTDWSADELDHTLENAGSTPHQKVKKSKRNSIDLTKMKKQAKAQQSPRRNERGTSSKNGSARNTPRSARKDEDDDDDDASTLTTSTKRPPLSRSGSQKAKKKPIKKKGVTFRVPLEDRHCYDLTAESYAAGDMSMNEDEFEKKVLPAAAKQPSSRELRRMNSDRRKRHQKGILPSLARCCIS